MIDVPQSTRKVQVEELKKQLPFYVSNENSSILVVDVTNNYFRDTEPFLMYSLATKEPSKMYPKETIKVGFTTNQIFTKSEEEATRHFMQEKAKKIASRFEKLKKEYEYSVKFMAEHPHYFV